MLRASAFALGILLFVSAAPAIPALVGPPVGNQDPVSWFSVYSYTTGSYCSSYDAAVGLASAAPLASLTTSPSGSTTRWQFHIAPLPTDTAPCPSIDLALFAAITPWPSTQQGRTASASCGLTGMLFAGATANGLMAFFMGNVPSACHAGISGSIVLGVGVARLQSSEYNFCPPVPVALPCAGAYEDPGASSMGCAPGNSNGGTYVTGYVGVYRWCSQGDAVYLSHPVGLFQLEARRDSCKITFYDLPETDTSALCPAAVGELLWSQRWGAMLP